VVDVIPDTAVTGRRRRRSPYIAAAVGVVLLAFIGVLATRQPAEQRDQQSPLVGKAVPELSGATLDGSQYDIDGQRGRYVLVNFFASWCVPCQIEHPELVEFAERHRAAGDASVVSVSFQDSEAAIRRFFAERGGSWPVIAGQNLATLDFGVAALPESFLVDPNGLVVAKFVGGVRADQVDAAIAAVEASRRGQPAPGGGSGR
jgi:cytochrome c biogenesis protein CcmG/thiol:disulfide interchange protein DsbE